MANREKIAVFIWNGCVLWANITVEQRQKLCGSIAFVAQIHAPFFSPLSGFSLH